MKVWRSGTRLYSRASSRTRSRPGVSSRSATTLIEHLERVGEAQPAPGQQHGEVVEQVGGLLGHALVRLVARRARDLLGLLLDLRADARRVGEQLGGVAAGRAGGPSLVDGALERGQRLGRLGAHVAAVEAGALAGVAGGAGRLDQRQQGVLVAVVAQRV